MEQYIPKSAVLAEIRKYKNNAEAYLKYHHNRNDKSVYAFEQEKLVMCDLLYFIDTLEVKEIDLEKEYKNFVEDDPVYSKLVNYIVGKAIAKHFFKLGMRVNNPITAADRGIAEEIIISLKQVENDYYLDQTKEIEWVRNKVKEEEV